MPDYEKVGGMERLAPVRADRHSLAAFLRPMQLLLLLE